MGVVRRCNGFGQGIGSGTHTARRRTAMVIVTQCSCLRGRHQARENFRIEHGPKKENGMDEKRKGWNENQKALRQALARAGDHQKGIELFLKQHAAVHSAQVSHSGQWSYADDVWLDLPEKAVRSIPRNGEHSIAWIMWHIARIEDVTMNMLVAGGSQLLHRDSWFDRLGVAFHDTGNGMDEAGIADVSATIDVEVLRTYRMAVGRGTRELVKTLSPDDLRSKVDSARIQRVRDEEAVLAAGHEVVDYWSKRDIAGLLLMPPTRHNFVHLNEAWRVRQRVT
jgi:hypothetical protein